MTACRWCGATCPGPTPLCDAKCFGWATRAGWWDGWSIIRRKAIAAMRRVFPDARLVEIPSGGDEVMPFQPKVNQAGLFINTQHPDKSDFNGQIEVQCAHCGKVTSFWLAGWRKTTKAGAKYLSLALRPKGKTSANGQSQAAQVDSDDIL